MGAVDRVIRSHSDMMMHELVEFVIAGLVRMNGRT